MVRGSLSLSSALVTSALLAGCSGADSIDDAALGSRQEAVAVCAQGPTVDGIDVSSYQGKVDWGAVASDGKAFAIARINHGDDMDPQFDANWAGMKVAGLIRGAYQFFDADGDALEQAQVVVERIGKLGPGDLPAVIDIESAAGEAASIIISRVQTWLDHVEAGTGKRPIVYTGKNFWQGSVGTDQFVGYPLWVANYYVDCPNLPDGAWGEWLMHQHADNGSVAGIDGAVDLNRFNGTVDDLAAFASHAAGAYGAELLETGYRATMTAGEIGDAHLTLRNSGVGIWDAATRLATSEPRGRESAFATSDWLSGKRVAAVAGEVSPGERYSFELTLRAPSEPGVYREHFNLIQERVAWFSDPGQAGPNDTAIVLEITVVPEGARASASIGGTGTSPGTADDDSPSAAHTHGSGRACAVCAPGAAVVARPAWLCVGALLLAVRRRRGR